MNPATALISEDTDPDLVAVGDETPPLAEQARLHGWKAGIFDFGKAESREIAHFNPGLVRRPDGLWLLVRRSEDADGMPYGRNGIWACKLEGNERKPLGGPLLKFPDSKDDEQFEDPRAIYFNGQTWVAAVNFTWFPNGSWTGAHQMLGVFKDDEEWTAVARRDPPVGTNRGEAGHTDGKHNKNFTWFFFEGKLHLIYTSDPWLVIEFGVHWEDQRGHECEGVKWKYGQVRGGTPPILVGDMFYTFFHSSLPWRGRFRRYFMGCMAFENKPPFRPVLWTQEPMLIGSQNDPWEQRKPLVVFPCGAVFENDFWFISYGINDLKSGWVEIPHEDVVKMVSPVPIAEATILLSEATPRNLPVPVLAEPEPFSKENRAARESTKPVGPSNGEVADNSRGGQNLTPMQARAAHMRSVAAENRAKGIAPKPKRRRRMKRRKRKTLPTA